MGKATLEVKLRARVRKRSWTVQAGLVNHKCVDVKGNQRRVQWKSIVIPGSSKAEAGGPKAQVSWGYKSEFKTSVSNWVRSCLQNTKTWLVI